MSRSADLARLVLERQMVHETQVECASCGMVETVVGFELPDTWRPVYFGEEGYHVCSDLCECRWNRVPIFDPTTVFEWADLDED